MFPCPRWKHAHSTEKSRNRCVGKRADKKLRSVGYMPPAQREYHHFPGIKDTINGLPIVRFSGSEIIKGW